MPPGDVERWRDIGGAVGVLPAGERNAITDVAGVQVGHAQASSGERTGVTVVAPPGLPTAAGITTINGVGMLTPALEIAERGLIETPVYLCGSHATGTVMQAAVTASGRGPEDVVLPVVGECDDGYMADSRTVVAGDVERALAALGPEVAEGSVGAGTGMTCFDFPGGIGTASRVVGGYRVGVLLLCNFGDRERLAIDGLALAPLPEKRAPHGSCIAVCATDAPLPANALRRLAMRPLLGLARAGSYASEGSGEIGLAFTTATGSDLPRAAFDALFAAAYEAAHEAVFNCLVAARPAEQRDGTMQDAFPVDEIRRAARPGSR